MKADKFKIGQTVKCFHNDTARTRKGCGWSDGLEFTISEITHDNHEGPCYWPGYDGCGVFEAHLKLISLWDTKEN